MRQRFFHTFTQVKSNKYFPVIVLIIINLLIGALVLTDYGVSWDEAPSYLYAKNSLDAYLNGSSVKPDDEKGPFFVMATALASDLIFPIRQNWLIEDARHYVQFLTFLVGLFFLYRLAYRLTNKWAAFGVVLLFNTQPLLWGHSFINPKDIAFMVFFMGSVDLGITMVDAYHHASADTSTGNPQKPPLQPIRYQFRDEWNATPSKRKLIIIICLAGILLSTGLFLSQGIIQAKIESLVFDVYANNTNQILANIFSSVALNKEMVPVESYIQKAQTLYTRLTYRIYPSFMILAATFILILLPTTRSALWQDRIIPFGKGGWKHSKETKLILAGIFLGFSSSIRTLGPAAGVLISLYLLLKDKGRSLQVLIAYFFIAGIATYLTWPSLWDSPIRIYIASLTKASDFHWNGTMLFNGNLYRARTFPISYFPVLICIQFTLTALLAIVTGFFFAVYKTFKKTLDWRLFAILVLWFIAPFISVFVFDSSIYDNFRHLFFAIPPLFVFSAFGFQGVFALIKKPLPRILIILAFILPNIFSLIKLHPYQYIYYNAFTNGLNGAYRNYELDYWSLSYKEAADYLNQNAPPNSRVLVHGASHIVDTYARKDLDIDKLEDDLVIDDIDCASPMYLVVSTRVNADTKIFPDAVTIHTIGIDKAVFTVVKDLNTSHLCNP